MTLALHFSNSILEIEPKTTVRRIYARLCLKKFASKKHRVTWKKFKNIGEQFARAYKLGIDIDMEHYNRKFIKSLSEQNLDLALF